MKLNTIAICIVISFVLIISSCKKDDLTADAIILNYGSPAADGCGWVIKISSTDSTYSPINLPLAYQKDNLKVHIAYLKLKTKYYCGDVVGYHNGPTQIKLDAIKAE